MMENLLDEITSERTIDWLLEPDEKNAPLRFLALRDILDQAPGSSDLENARDFMIARGPIPEILLHQQPEGYWYRPDEIYYGKYTGSCWQIITLAQMGADKSIKKVDRGCEYLLEHGLGEHGGFSVNGRQSGAAHCIQGNLAAALIDLGFGGDARVAKAVEWMARSVTGAGFSDKNDEIPGERYMRSGISGPAFLCSSNNHEACAWGAIKAALALSKVPQDRRTPVVENAIKKCIEFLIGVDPATADYPHPYAPKPSTSWFKFGFPVFYITDLLQNLEALAGLGLRKDPRLRNTVELVLSKRDKSLRWLTEYSYNGKTWVDFEEKGNPGKWVTWRALRALKNYSAQT